MSRITDAMARYTASQAARTCECGKPSVQSGIAQHLNADERKLLGFLDKQDIRFCSVKCFHTFTAQPAKKEA